ncbi:MAG: TetR family transcriptional regulator [Myxococcota bacterium]|jgi:AcrR family transcriptional regulator|nr:TetR family transcriptional regulator [Myxococcota bacterium]
MARPLDHDKRRTLAREAVTVMQREGADVSMTRLAEALGLKRPTLLYHFPTRAQIVETALEEMMMAQAAFVLGRIAQESHPLRRLYAQVRAVHEFQHGNEARLVFLTQALAATGGERMKELVHGAAKIFEAHRRANADRIRAGIEAGLVAPCDPDALVQLVRAVIDGLMLQRVTEGIELEPVHRLLWENLLAPLARDPHVDAAPIDTKPLAVRSSDGLASRGSHGTDQGADHGTDVGTGVREALKDTQNDERPRRSSAPPPPNASHSAPSPTKRASRSEVTKEPRS